MSDVTNRLEQVATSWLKTAHKNAGWVIALGVLQIIAGVVMIFSPLAGGLTVTVVLGLGMMLGGVAGLFAAFGADSFGAGTLAFLWSLLVAVLGFHIATNPGLGLATLTLMLAVIFFAGGLSQIIVAFKMKPIQGWGWALTGGIVGVLAAFMIWRQFPFSGLWLVGTLAGVQLLVGGMTTVTVAGAARKLTA